VIKTGGSAVSTCREWNEKGVRLWDIPQSLNDDAVNLAIYAVNDVEMIARMQAELSQPMEERCQYAALMEMLKDESAQVPSDGWSDVE